MTPDTQFILFITDHGELALPTENVQLRKHGTASSDLYFNPEWTVRSSLAKGLLADANNQPGVSLSFGGSAPSDFAVGDLAVLLGGTTYEQFEKFTIDLNGDGDILDAEEGFRLFFPIPETALGLVGDSKAVLNIDVVNNTDTDLLVRTMSLDTGSVAPVPEPSLVAMLVAGGLMVLLWVNGRRSAPKFARRSRIP